LTQRSGSIGPLLGRDLVCGSTSAVSISSSRTQSRRSLNSPTSSSPLGLRGPTRLQVGLVGYEQRQTTAKAGPAVSEDQSRQRYAINALGVTTHLVFPNHRFNAGVRFFEEFSNRAAYQGCSLQVSGAVSF